MRQIRNALVTTMIVMGGSTATASLGLQINGYVKSIDEQVVVAYDTQTKQTHTFDRKKLNKHLVAALFKKMDRSKSVPISIPITAKIHQP